MLAPENNITITKEWLASIGFTIVDANHHLYEVESYIPDFYVIKRHGKDNFTVIFEENVMDFGFEGFYYQHQILNLYYCLNHKHL